MQSVLAPADGVILAAAAAVSSIAAFVLVTMGPEPAFALALLPPFAVGVVYLLTSAQIALFAAAVALPMSALPALGNPLVGPLFAADLVAGLALGAVILSRFLMTGKLPPVPRTPVLGLPLVLFGAAVVAATLRGHYEFGASLFGQPLRLVLYAAIVGAFIGMTVHRMYAFLQILFYAVAVWAVVLSAYVLAAGGSVSGQDPLSTGGTRVLSISASVYCAGALFFAMLSLRFGFGSRWLHIGMGAVSLFGVVVGFGRAVYTAVAIVAVLFLLTSSRLRRAVLGAVPIALPFLALVAIGLALVTPDLVESMSNRFFSPPKSDENVRWRVQANEAVLEQVREQPLIGVGFGKPAEFFFERTNPGNGLPEFHRVPIGQDPHNAYMFFLAGGGIILLVTFLILIATFAYDAVRRYRSTTDSYARFIILWAGALLFVFLVNAASTTTFSVGSSILSVWALLALPAIVRTEPVEVADAQALEGSGLHHRPAW